MKSGVKASSGWDGQVAKEAAERAGSQALHCRKRADALHTRWIVGQSFQFGVLVRASGLKFEELTRETLSVTIGVKHHVII